ncbi:MAG: hypothetical protein IJV17_06060 [Prevotella sp.]|nr:hypothetical protein [Prevotella sp.]
MKTKLLKLALCALALLPLGAWAADVANSATATWLFGQYGKNLNVTGTDNVIDYDGLYVALGTRTVTSVMARLTNATKDGDDVIFPSGYYTGLFFNGTRGAGYSGAASDTGAGGRMSLRVTKPGKIYVLCRNSASGREVKVFKGTTEDAKLPDNTKTDFQMITVSISQAEITAGSGKVICHIVGMNGTSQASCTIYGVKYVVSESAGQISKTVTIPSCGYVTFSGPHTYTIAAHTKSTTPAVYYASSENGSDVTLTATESNRIPACQGVIIKGAADDVLTLKSVEDQITASGNLLVANLATYALPATTTINTGSDETNYNYILLPDGTSNAVFKHTTGSGDLAANKAFLRTTTNVSATSRGIELSIGGGGATGISVVEGQKTIIDNVYYNLNGQRVAHPTKGLYIVNGKKVILK